MGVNSLSMFWRLVMRSLRLRFSRLLIIFCALTLGASIVSAMASLYLDINSKMSQTLRTFGANLYISAINQPWLAQGELEQMLNQAPEGIIEAASPYLYGIARSSLEQIAILGVWFEQMNKLAPYWQITGQPIRVNFDQRHAMIGKKLAERLQLKLGDSIQLIKANQEKKSFTIKAIIESGDAVDNMLIVNLAFAQSWLDKPKQANSLLLSVNNQQNQAEHFALQLQQQYLQWNIQLIRQISVAEGLVLEKITRLMGFISLVILILATLCVNTSLTALINERRQEFALQKALGASRAEIMWQISAEVLLICGLAVCCGLILGYLLAQLLGLALFNGTIAWRLAVIPITLILSLTVATLAAILPAKGALNAPMAGLLKGE